MNIWYSRFFIVLLMVIFIQPTMSQNRAERYNQEKYTHSANIYPLNDKKLLDQTYTPQQIDDILEDLFKETIMLPMRDGVRLSTQIFKSPFDERPTIVVRTPYNKDEFEILGSILYINGYSVVLQDTRGRFDSEGEDMVFQSDGWGELQDGYDTIEWVAEQSWSDGNVGIWGYSAIGITALMAVGAEPPHLKCAVAGYTPTKGWGQTAYQGGVFRQSLVEEWLIGNNSEHMLPVFLEHDQNDEFWDLYDIETQLNQLDNPIPILHIGGWYDCFQKGTINAFSILQDSNINQSENTQQLILGPWTHVNHYSQTQGQVTFPSNAIWKNELEETLAWFDHWLKGKENNVTSEPAVTYYVMNLNGNHQQQANIWKTSDSWPPQNKNFNFYLHNNNSLSQSTENINTFSTIIINSASPVPTIGGMNLEIAAGPYNQQVVESRNDVITYTSEPFTNPVEIVGNIAAQIYASANVENFDVSVRISEVFPDGTSMLLCDGIKRASFRQSETNPTPLPIGEVAELQVDCWSTSVVINAGNRLRVDIAPSNYPRFAVNPTTYQLDEPSEFQSEIYIHISPDHPSHISIPVVSGMGTSVQQWNLY